MRRDEIAVPISYLSVLVMLGVKAFTVIVFVFVVLIAGLNYQKTLTPTLLPTTSEPITTTVTIKTTVPDLMLGPQIVFAATPVPATLAPIQTEAATIAPSQTLTQTPAPTNTNIPTGTSIPTETSTNTNVPMATSTITSIPTSKSTVTATNLPKLISTPTLTALPTLRPSVTLLPTSTVTKTVISTPVSNALVGLVASPLTGIASSELNSIITQTFELPPLGEDSGHHGVDFAFWRRDDLESIEGVPVVSIFAGKVVSAYSKIRTPYGYMVIVETPLSNLPIEVVNSIKLPEATQIPGTPSNRLTCPAGFADWWSTDSKSLYVLYAHMGEPPLVKLGRRSVGRGWQYWRILKSASAFGNARRSIQCYFRQHGTLRHHNNRSGTS
jgi:murein DD-endopeptidase MepM/ murein hydrolase activator NlpD